MTALKPAHQAFHRRPQHTDFFTSKLLMSKPKVSAGDINESVRHNQSERTIRIKEILQKQQVQQQIQQSENMQRDPTLIQFNDLSTLS
jgi:hypothetical protein